VVISDGAGVGAENRKLEIEFVIPGKRIADMDELEPPRPSSSSPRPPMLDLTPNKPNSGVPLVSAFKKPGGSWMD
jgi:hypothetical protein